MTSREYAKRLREIADVLDSRPEFEAPYKPHVYHMFSDKDQFVTAAKAMGAGKKEFTTGGYSLLNFKPDAIPEMTLTIARDKVCRKVQEETWECEPMLSAGEEKELIVGEADGIPY